MDRFFDANNPVMKALSRMVDMAVLNLMTIACMIPIVTAGASITAMNNVLIHIVRKDETYVWKMFLTSFRQNLKQGIWMTLLLILLCIVLYVDLNISRNTSITLGPLLSLLLLALFCVFAMVASYLFPLQAQFENTIRGTLKNALFMSIWHLPYTLVILLLNLLPVLLFFLSPVLFTMSLIGWALLGVAGVAYLNSRLVVKIFDRYIPEEEKSLE